MNALRSARRKGSSSSTMRMRIGTSCLRNGQGDARAAALGGFDAHLAALAFHHVTREVEAEACAAARLLGGEERLAQPAQERLGHAHAVVGDGEVQLVADARQ